MAQLIVPSQAQGGVIVCDEGLSFWGGVDPKSGRVIDARHSQVGTDLAGKVVLMPTSRGSCSGSGVLLDLALSGMAPAALVFREAEDILTLGALIAAEMFNRPLAVLRLGADDYALLAKAKEAEVDGTTLRAHGWTRHLAPLGTDILALTLQDREMLDGTKGRPVQLAMRMLCRMAAAQGAQALTDVTRAHIDGCIYAHPANLIFAQEMAAMGARVRVPTTINAISVDRDNWQRQGVPPVFGNPAAQLADAYVTMGAQPTFTCAPYLLEDAPAQGEDIGWSESNAVIYANSVLGARTVKHPDYLDLFIAITGRAPLSGVYLPEERRARRVVEVDLPEGADDALWPMLGWLVGRASPDRIPLLTGLERASPDADALKAVCAAFGTTSAAPMLHMSGITPECHLPPASGADRLRIGRSDFADAWSVFNGGPEQVDLVALGSPHFSLAETRRFAALMRGRQRHAHTEVIVTLGRGVLQTARAEGLIAVLQAAGVQVYPDICLCSITEPLFPPTARTLMTNSGKYAHYAPGLSGRAVRFGSLAQCADTAVSGKAPGAPAWLATP